MLRVQAVPRSRTSRRARRLASKRLRDSALRIKIVTPDDDAE